MTSPQPPYGHSPQPYPQQHSGQYGYQQPPAQYYQQHPSNAPVQLPPPPKKARKKWPWIVAILVLIPILGFAGCMAVLGGAVNAVDEARKGGSAPAGQTLTYASGLAISASVPAAWQSGSPFDVGRTEQGWESVVTITNGTKNPVGAALISIDATVAGAPAAEVYSQASFATQQIAPGQSLKIPFHFKVPKGTKGPVQIAVTDTLNEPMFFASEIA